MIFQIMGVKNSQIPFILIKKIRKKHFCTRPQTEVDVIINITRETTPKPLAHLLCTKFQNVINL